MPKKQAVLSLSGGMDSSTLLLHLLANDYQVTALSFDYGQKHRVELERAQDLVNYIKFTNASNQDAPVFLTHQIIKLDGLAQLLDSALVTGGDDVPEGHYEQENMKETVVPNRNKIFSSITQAVALSIAKKTGQECIIALGLHAGDFAVYPDCREEFRQADLEAFRIGNWDSHLVNFYTPYMEVTKLEILQDGLLACEKLGLIFNEVYKRTNTSYKPMMHDGKWYSDYKSAASVERIEAFITLGHADSVAYADEHGPVEWETAKSHVEKVLAEHGK